MKNLANSLRGKKEGEGNEIGPPVGDDVDPKYFVEDPVPVLRPWVHECVGYAWWWVHTLFLAVAYDGIILLHRA